MERITWVKVSSIKELKLGEFRFSERRRCRRDLSARMCREKTIEERGRERVLRG